MTEKQTKTAMPETGTGRKGVEVRPSEPRPKNPPKPTPSTPPKK
jgi:hypothetical protein